MEHSSRPTRVKVRRKWEYGPVTTGLCVVFGAVFLLEAYVDGGSLWQFTPSAIATLGGTTAKGVLVDGEYWRLITSALLHTGILHVAFNAYATLIIGSALEKVLGPGWVIGPFVLAAVTGSYVSANFIPGNGVSAGASGGIFGLVAMAALLSYLAPYLTGFSRQVLTQWLIFALAIGFAAGFDNWGHIGGIGGGAIAALPALALRNRPELVRKVGWGFGAVGLLVMVAAVGLGARAIVADSQSLGASH